MAFDWNTIRREFPVLEKWVYLNSATFGPVPSCATAAVTRHFEHRNDEACLDFIDWFADADRVRAKIAKLIHAEADDIAFAPHSAAALSWLMHGIDWKPGDRIVSLSHEFPNNLYYPLAWQDRGVEFIEAQLPDGAFTVDGFLSNLNARTRLVILSSVNYSTGLRPPLEEIGAALHERGILFYVDGTQSVGALRLDVRAANVDFMALHAYKWMLSPSGIGFAYVSAEVREWLEPTIYSWRSHRDWRNVSSLHHGRPELPQAAMKYEGGIQNFPGIYGLEAVLDLMEAIGYDLIERRVLELAAKVRDTLRENGGVLLADRFPYFDSPIVTAQFPGEDTDALAKELRSRRIVVAARKGNLRVSPHFFNSPEDVAMLGVAMKDFRAQ